MSAPSRWREIESVLAGALDLPAGQRDAYVDAICGADSPVSTEVRALIRAYEHAGDFLDPVTFHDKWAGVEADAFEGKAAGAYRLKRVLGRGGMGVVYLAGRDDDQFEKEVAVKLVNSALYSPSLARRFRDERQILASLEHPNIARLLDAGLTAEGIPFIVMEYVDGEPIHEYCRRRNLPVRERLALFVKVCEAVDFAHRNFVVHRDLKPSNILVTADGCPKLLDFGIAKMLAGTGMEAGATAPPTQALTPDYASPEQLRGGNLTTASDVYSLGVLLYELLAGQRPYALAGKPLAEILRTVCDEDPESPSASVARSHPKLAKELKGDLDHIVARALRKPASERYGSAEELARDIGHHLEGLPIEARRGSWGYTVGRYVRRYRIALAGGLIVIMSAGIGVAAVVRQMRIAERRFQEVQRLAHSVIYELHDGIARLPGSIPIRQLLVTRALEFLDPLAREAQDNQPLTIQLAEAYIRIGEVQGGFTMPSQGRDEVARASFHKAHSLLLPLYQARPADSQIARLMGLTYFRLATAMAASGDFAKSLEYTGQSEEAYSSALRAAPNDEKAMLGLAGAYFSRAVAMGQLNRDSLSEYWRKSLDIYERMSARGSKDPGLDRSYSRSLTFYSSRLSAAGKKREAMEALERSHALNEDRLAAAPGDQAAATDLVMSHHMLGQVLNDLGRPEEALASLQKALALVERLSLASPEDMYLRDRLAWCHAALGDQLMAMKRYAKALARYRETIRIYEDFARNRPGVGFSRAAFAETWVNMGRIEQRMGRHAAACNAFTQATKVYVEIDKVDARKRVRDLAAEARKHAAACGVDGNAPLKR